MDSPSEQFPANALEEAWPCLAMTSHEVGLSQKDALGQGSCQRAPNKSSILAVGFSRCHSIKHRAGSGSQKWRTATLLSDLQNTHEYRTLSIRECSYERKLFSCPRPAGPSRALFRCWFSLSFRRTADSLSRMSLLHSRVWEHAPPSLKQLTSTEFLPTAKDCPNKNNAIVTM